MRLALAMVLALALIQPAHGRWIPCWLVRLEVQGKTQAEREQIAKAYKLTDQERAAALACIRKGKPSAG